MQPTDFLKLPGCGCHYCLLEEVGGPIGKVPKGFLSSLWNSNNADDMSGMKDEVYKMLAGPHGRTIFKAMLIKWEDENNA